MFESRFDRTERFLESIVFSRDRRTRRRGQQQQWLRMELEEKERLVLSVADCVMLLSRLEKNE